VRTESAGYWVGKDRIGWKCCYCMGDCQWFASYRPRYVIRMNPPKSLPASAPEPPTSPHFHSSHPIHTHTHARAHIHIRKNIKSHKGHDNSVTESADIWLQYLHSNIFSMVSCNTLFNSKKALP
jgi:hypothetical protein